MNFLEIDNSIGFIGIPNKFGKKIVAEYSKGLVQLLTEYELELYAIESVLRMNTRSDMKTNLDKPIYSLTLYRKVRRAHVLCFYTVRKVFIPVYLLMT